MAGIQSGKRFAKGCIQSIDNYVFQYIESRYQPKKKIGNLPEKIRQSDIQLPKKKLPVEQLNDKKIG